jgi:hypothetical protein
MSAAHGRHDPHKLVRRFGGDVGIGSCYLKLTPEQYKKLNASRTATAPKLKL